MAADANLCLLCALLNIAALQHAVKVKTTVVVDRRKGSLKVRLAAGTSRNVEFGIKRRCSDRICGPFNESSGHFFTMFRRTVSNSRMMRVVVMSRTLTVREGEGVAFASKNCAAMKYSD